MRTWLAQHRFYVVITLASAILLGILVSMPNVLHTIDARYKGVPVQLNADEFGYMPRVQEYISGYRDRLGVAIGGGEHIPALQPGILEEAYGTVFRLLGVDAAHGFVLMDFVEPALLFVLLVILAVLMGFTPKEALGAAWMFSLIQLYNLNRPVHQRGSFILVVLTLIAFCVAMERRYVWSIVAGVLWGLLVGVYFWSWTYVGVFWGIALLHALTGVYVWWRQDTTWFQWLFHPLRLFSQAWSASYFWRQLKSLLLGGALAVIMAIPSLLVTAAAGKDPAYAEAFARSGVAYSHVPESWVWSLLFLLMAIGTVGQFWSSKNYRLKFLCYLIVASCIVISQQLVHGITFEFTSHYLFPLVWSAVLVCIACVLYRGWFGYIALVASVIFLAGVAWDGRSLAQQWNVEAEDFSEQHLASAVPVLKELPMAMVLTDTSTSAFVASHTQHDVLFTWYMQHELRRHGEIAERYCLTQEPLSPELRKPQEEHVLIYGDGYDAYRTYPEKAALLRQEELRQVKEACARIDANPESALQAFGVQYVLWDEQRNPQWDLSRLRVHLQEASWGEGWSLWRVAR